ncbi:MAG: metal-dependent phosphohydrolase [Planctomycetes bacterium]|nr:metal-dependent phosphohydrolase [Planctomycetota bacterium]
MHRERALEILHEMTETESLRRHARTVEIVMRALCAKHGEDADEWGAAGMLHDADYEKWPDDHPNRIVARLREIGEDRIAHAISAHYTKWEVPHDTLLSRALIAADELTGFTVACCLVRPDGVHSLTPKSVKKKFKDKKFAAKVERAEIARALEIYGVEFADQVQAIIDALKPHADELAIGGGV